MVINMENKQTLGAGIKVISIILLIGSVMAVFGAGASLMMSDSMNQVLIESGQGDIVGLPTKLDYAISLGTSILNIIFVSLILMKNKIGVFGYFTLTILNTVYSTIVSWAGVLSLLSLGISIGILILYGYFIYQKRELYGFEKQTTEVTN